MADNRNSSPPDRYRHARHPVPRRRRHALLIVVGALVVAAVAAVLVLSTWDEPRDAVAADRAVATSATSTSSTSPSATTPAPTASGTASAPDVPAEFVAAMQQTGIPLDPHTGWVVAQGICVRLGQPEYDRFRMSEGVERLFPSVPDDQAHAFVDMVAESVCHV